MTVGRWLDAHLGGVPDPLADRLRELLSEDGARGADELPEAAVAAAERTAASLLRERCTGRDGALDLLAADALVTTAFEAAADAPERLPERARDALRRLAAVADAGGAGA